MSDEENPLPPESGRSKAAKAQARMIVNYQRVFQDGVGKEVLQDMFKMFGMLEHNGNQDPHKTMFYEGQRSVVLFIIARLKMNSNQVLERLQETTNENF